MAPKPEKKFCTEHEGTQLSSEDNERTVCPYDPKHTCYVSKLQHHLKKCNARPKELPEYIIPKVNLFDLEYSNLEDEIYSITSVPDETLVDILQKIERVYIDENLECQTSILAHKVMELAITNPALGMNTKKHLIQNSSLLKNMENFGFLDDNVTFIEFGAGRGHLGFWISQATEKNENCALVLIDKASHRHKSDNKLKGVSPVLVLRIRADIADIKLANIPLLANSRNAIVGVAKHLCGGAADLALRCMVQGKINGLSINGVLMAFCCHHRCSWNSYVGKQFLLDMGFSPRQFSALCSISSWATCGCGKPRSKMAVESSVEMGKDRYGKFGLSQEARETIGKKCKMILNQGRLKYLEKNGFDGNLLHYVEPKISPENVCLIGKVSGAR